jgi:predicted MFS family arabinose efflux permease
VIAPSFFLSALLNAAGNTARRALLPEVARVADVRLKQANAAEQAIQRAASFIGPAIAGVLVAWLGTSKVLWLGAATWFLGRWERNSAERSAY